MVSILNPSKFEKNQIIGREMGITAEKSYPTQVEGHGYVYRMPNTFMQRVKENYATCSSLKFDSDIIWQWAAIDFINQKIVGSIEMSISKKYTIITIFDDDNEFKAENVNSREAFFDVIFQWFKYSILKIAL